MHVTYSMRISSITCIKKTTHTPLLLSTVHCWNCTELAPVIDLITSSSQESRQIAKRIPLSCLESVFFFMTCSRQLWCGGARSVRRTWWRTYEEGVGGAVVRQELHRLRVEPEPKSHGQHQQAWQLRNKDQHGNHPLSRKRTKKSNFKTLLKHGSCFHVTCLVTSPEKTEAHRGVVFFFLSLDPSRWLRFRRRCSCPFSRRSRGRWCSLPVLSCHFILNTPEMLMYKKSNSFRLVSPLKQITRWTTASSQMLCTLSVR